MKRGEHLAIFFIAVIIGSIIVFVSYWNYLFPQPVKRGTPTVKGKWIYIKNTDSCNCYCDTTIIL